MLISQDLGLLFNIYPHTVHTKTRHGDRIIKLFKEIFDTIALVGDIPEDAGDELVSFRHLSCFLLLSYREP